MKTTRPDWILRAVIAVTIWASATPAWARPDRQEVGQLSAGEITALQQRLTDAGCYSGPKDGRTSDALRKAVNACPDQRPSLQIETSLHQSSVQRVGADAQCRVMATGSDDKTVRLWSLADGALLRTLRWPIDRGGAGRIYAAAVSPDGRFVAAGGEDARLMVDNTGSIAIFDAATGAMVARVGAVRRTVSKLVFSRDGKWLAATLLGGHGVRVFDTSTWRQVAADENYGGRGSHGAVFAPDGRLYTAAEDGHVRRYGPGPAFRPEATIKTRGGTRPFAITIDPRGEHIAVSFTDAPVIDVFDAPDLSFRATTEKLDPSQGGLAAVAWHRDGTAFVAGGRSSNAKESIFRFDRNGRRIGQHVSSPATDTIMDLQPCGDGFVVAAADPALGLLDASGRQRLWRSGVGADLRGKRGDNFMLSADGALVRFGLGYRGERPVLFDLRRAALSDSPTVPPGLTAAMTGGLPIANWQNTTEPTLAGKPVALNQAERSLSLAIRPSGAGFVLGTDWYLRSFDTTGKEIWKKSVSSSWGVNASSNGRLVVAAIGDGTVRWYRASDGQELLALFVHRGSKAWVAWTPSGYYSASPGGEDMIGWHVNRGWEQAADFFPAAQFRDKYSRPDVVERVLDTLDEDEAVKAANAAANRPANDQALITRLPPVLSIVSPAQGSTFSGSSVEISYEVRSPSGLPVDRVDVRVNGEQGRGLARVDAKATRRSIRVDLPGRDSEVTLIARSGELAGEPVKLALRYAGMPAVADVIKPRLYALVIGVSDYVDGGLRLGFAAKDARDFARGLASLKGDFYANVTVRVLTDRDVTRASVEESLEWLERQVTQRDLAVIFLAGHGKTDEKQNFWFLPADATPERLRTTAVAQATIDRTLQGLPGKSLLFLDTCHAGRTTEATARSPVDINAAVSEFARAGSGATIFASSMGREVSLERPEWGNGAFTKALNEGLFEGKADAGRSGTITPAKLQAYIEDRVKELTGGRQHPVMKLAPGVPAFTIALSKR